MVNPLVIDGANRILRAPPGVDSCYDIYVRYEVDEDGTPYHVFEVELDEDERRSLLSGGTLILSQMGEAWVPLGVTVKPVR